MSGDSSVNDDGRFATAKVAADVLLDSRLALYHESQGWLAVGDLHQGCDPAMTARREMLALWGAPPLEERLHALLAHYRPARMILVGDVMHFNGDVAQACELIRKLAEKTQVVCVAGNHDRTDLVREMNFVNCHFEDGFAFHHGHRLAEMLAVLKDGKERPIHITAHSHPMVVLKRDGQIKRVPVFVQMPYPGATDGEQRWILPAFSPWASGAWQVEPDAVSHLYLMHPQSITQGKV